MIAEEAVVEALSDAVIQAGALSVSIEDAHADTVNEEPMYGEPGIDDTRRRSWNQSRLRVLIDQDHADMIIVAACNAAGQKVVVEHRLSVENNDWVRHSQAQFPSTQISERLWIVPTWHDPPPPPARVVRLDPGVAFGTGTHPTTRLCLSWLDQHLRPGASVLDYGCGSGILT
ncbi:MAG: 50S ribosomal protein L11 methyltransferase, partial [Pseudomonadota bacterium]|nr:50S ribosomal protein L11 methyltransferase [Pseudomonadota bacterium]